MTDHRQTPPGPPAPPPAPTDPGQAANASHSPAQPPPAALIERAWEAGFNTAYSSEHGMWFDDDERERTDAPPTAAELYEAELDRAIDALHGPGAAAAINRALADGTL